MMTITRKRDESWNRFLDSFDDDAVIMMTPEGRMKRPSGLDKHGDPMTVRGGVVGFS